MREESQTCRFIAQPAAELLKHRWGNWEGSPGDTIQVNPQLPPDARERHKPPSKGAALEPNALGVSLSLSSPGHEGLSNPLGLVAPPDVCGGFGWGVKAEFVLPLSLSRA